MLFFFPLFSSMVSTRRYYDNGVTSYFLPTLGEASYFRANELPEKYAATQTSTGTFMKWTFLILVEIDEKGLSRIYLIKISVYGVSSTC